MLDELDVEDKNKVATDGVGKPVTKDSLETIESNVVKKLELTPEELDAIKAEAVAQAQHEQEERIRSEEAEKQGNYKVLFEKSEKEKKAANLELWRQKALNKFKLSEDLEDSLMGDTEEDLMKSAKKIKSLIDKEVEARLEAVNAPPPDPKKPTPPHQRTGNSDDTVKRNISRALNIGKVLH